MHLLLKTFGCTALAIGAMAPTAWAQTATTRHHEPTLREQCAQRMAPPNLHAQDPSSPINIRSGAGTNFSVRHIGYTNDAVDVLGSQMAEDGCWYQVQFVQSRAIGWVRGDFLEISLNP